MSDAEQILIFANPIAGRGKSLSIARRLEGRFRADGYDVRLLLKRPDALRPQDLPADARAAVVIGGDGTIRAVANRLVEGSGGEERGQRSEVRGQEEAEPAEQSAGPVGGPSSLNAEPRTLNPPPGPPLLVVPLGTANLMGRHLGIRWADETLEDQVSAAVRDRRVVNLDAGRANGRLFLLMAGVGFDAAVVHALDRIRRGPIGYVDYVLPAALALKDYQYPALRVTVDGREVWPPAPAVAFVGNVAEYGTGFPILPMARPDDGLLDVCVLPCRSPFDIARFLLLSTTGEHPKEEGVVYRRGRHVEITTPGTDAPVPVQVDGDAAGHTPVTVDLLPVRLPFIVP